MGNALKKSDIQEASVSLGLSDGLSAALERAVAVGAPKDSILDYISSDEWKALDEQEENILVFDPE